MNFLLKYLVLAIFLQAVAECFGQAKDSIVFFEAERDGFQINPETGDTTKFVLCGEHITTDAARFFSMLAGCERNQRIFLARYVYRADTFFLQPFDYKTEPAFVSIQLHRSSGPNQILKFLSADRKTIRGSDSSWIIRCFKRRKDVFFNRSEDSVVVLPRGKYDGIELLQLSKIFRDPIILFLDKRYDYVIVVNLPLVSLKRYIAGSGALKGRGVIKENCFFLNDSNDPFDIISVR
ncbi:MAG TPA: hypothetical protein VD993_00340 [Chitinophagaceae bacterium]|nr:hypothetical protein [Chitinophagaceae bacterium]